MYFFIIMLKCSLNNIDTTIISFIYDNIKVNYPILSILLEFKSNLNSFLIFNYLCKKQFLIPTSDIFSISNQKQFEKIALKVFRFQYENNLVYNAFCDFMKVKVQEVKSLQQIPFLPIQFA